MTNELMKKFRRRFPEGRILVNHSINGADVVFDCRLSPNFMCDETQVLSNVLLTCELKKFNKGYDDVVGKALEGILYSDTEIDDEETKKPALEKETLSNPEETNQLTGQPPVVASIPVEQEADKEKVLSGPAVVEEQNTAQPGPETGSFESGLDPNFGVVENTTAKQTENSSYDENSSLEEIVAAMTLEEAIKIQIPSGEYKGRPMGEVAVVDPGVIERYKNAYFGPDKRIQAAATIIFREAALNFNKDQNVHI